MTAQTVLDMAFRRIGQTRPGYTTSPELYADGLLEWQMLVDELNAERDSSFTKPDYVYPVATSGLANPTFGSNFQFLIGPVFTFSATLTIGSRVAPCTNTAGLILGMAISATGVPTGATIQAIAVNTSVTMSAVATANGLTTITVTPDFIGPRPDKITAANWIYPSSTNNVRIRISVIEQWQWLRIPILDIPAINICQSIYYDPQFPCGVINCSPPVLSGSGSFELFAFGVLNAPTSLTSVVDAPPGYWSMWRFMLADRLVPLATRENFILNNRQISKLAVQAKNAKERIMEVNKPNPIMTNGFRGGAQPQGGNSGFDYYSGMPY